MNTMKPTAIMQEKIWIKCPRCGFIPQLRMQGPIITPVKISRQVAHQMIVAGLSVYQIDPDTKQATELNLQNVFPGEGDPVAPDKKEPPKQSSGVNTDPITPVNLKGVTPSNPIPTQEATPDVPEKKDNESKSESVEATAVDSESVTSEPVKKEETDGSNDEKQNNSQNNNGNNNGNKNNKNKKHK